MTEVCGIYSYLHSVGPNKLSLVESVILVSLTARVVIVFGFL